MKEDKEIKTQEEGMSVEKLKTVADYLQTVTDRRARLEEREKELFDARQGMFKQSITIGVLTKNINERNAENATLKELLREIYNSIPATHDENDSMVKRHASALNEIQKILGGE